MHFISALRRRIAQRLARQSRGQSLVEFAMVLPILLMLVGGAVDLGRAYAATISLEGAAREGALYAARNPQCADDDGGTCSDPRTVRWHVEQELSGVVLSDFEASCYAAGVTDFSAPGKALIDCEDGDQYRVTVHSDFALVTPFLSAVITGPLDLSATSTSIVLTSFDAVNGVPVTIPTSSDDPEPPAGTCTVPDFTNGTRANDAEEVWQEVAQFTGNATVVGTGNFVITWQSQSAGAQLPCNSTITVSDSPQATPTPTPSATPTPSPTPTATPIIPLPSLPGLPTPTPSATPTPSPTPTPVAMCVVPNMTQGNTSVTQAQGLWQAAGFQSNKFSAERPPDGDYKVKKQSIAAGQSHPCLTTTILVENS